eukprot:TRINITY_DN190_c0_g1_i4.p1 TRINITY_DN190_c0_g1~~TRINITY_DN190_c0_g1_i4.p1  ORF type:complete len:267 (+),score=78.69 TRINITY_DN190_c0_g1_i4:3-803(+)
MALPLGSLVWIPHDDHCFWPAEVVGIDGDTVTVDTVMERSTVPLSSVSLVQDGSLDGIHDMTLLNDLNEAALLHTVRTRFSRGEIYTYTGSILVAVNPFQPLAIYTPDFCAAYSNPPAPPEQLPPHIFAIAQAALHSMIVNGKDQSIIVSGESGAGKTESTKLLLEYLVAVSGEGLIERSIKVAQQILQAHPVLGMQRPSETTIRRALENLFNSILIIVQILWAPRSPTTYLKNRVSSIKIRTNEIITFSTSSVPVPHRKKKNFFG